MDPNTAQGLLAITIMVCWSPIYAGLQARMKRKQQERKLALAEYDFILLRK